MKWWHLGIGLTVLACGGGEDFSARTCVPGVTQECLCPGGASGAQACRGDGSGYDACQCSNGSGGGAGAGGGGQSGSAGASVGTGGAGGSCTPRSTCPAAEPDGGAQLCGMLDDYCGGKLSCGCEFGECNGGACQCSRIQSWDQQCVMSARGPIAMQCMAAVGLVVTGCERAPGGFGFPPYAFCCRH